MKTLVITLVFIVMIIAIIYVLKKSNKKTIQFNETEYNSNDGMMTSIWGPPLWHFLHTMSFNYPVNPSDQDKINYSTFIKSLQHILPCRYCRDNFKDQLISFPLDLNQMKSRESFSRWMYDLHNRINKRLDKKHFLTYEEVRDIYENFRSRCIKGKEQPVKEGIEKGCVDAYYGTKSKCILKITPIDDKAPSLTVDDRCYVKKHHNTQN